MKNTIKVLFVISISVASYLLSNKKTEKNKFVLFNIEALATPESGSLRCYGLGSVDCPHNSAKVLYIR